VVWIGLSECYPNSCSPDTGLIGHVPWSLTVRSVSLAVIRLVRLTTPIIQHMNNVCTYGPCDRINMT